MGRSASDSEQRKEDGQWQMKVTLKMLRGKGRNKWKAAVMWENLQLIFMVWISIVLQKWCCTSGHVTESETDVWDSLSGRNIVGLLHFSKRWKIKTGQKRWFALGRNLASCREWESDMCALMLQCGRYLHLPQHLLQQGCFNRHAGSCQSGSGSCLSWSCSLDSGMGCVERQQACLWSLGAFLTHLLSHSAKPPLVSQISLRILCWTAWAWELKSMISDPDLHNRKTLSYVTSFFFPFFFFMVIWTTKVKLRQREASSKPFLCSHYPFFHPCNNCFHGDWSKPVLGECYLLVPISTETWALDYQKWSCCCPVRLTKWQCSWTSFLPILCSGGQLQQVSEWQRRYHNSCMDAVAKSGTLQVNLKAHLVGTPNPRHHTLQTRKHQWCNVANN